jgi:broad specificity phosphatase PhoE
MTRFWLARHGETDWNLEGRFQGQADSPLNATGVEQANELAEMVAGKGIQAIYCSDLIRALQTAQIIGERLGLEPLIDLRLREIRLGEWEGMQLDDIKATYPEIWDNRRGDPVNAHPPGGENLVELAERVWAAADEIAQQHPGGTILIVAHGVSLACMLCLARDLPLGQAFQVIPENAHPVQVEWRENIHH